MDVGRDGREYEWIFVVCFDGKMGVRKLGWVGQGGCFPWSEAREEEGVGWITFEFGKCCFVIPTHFNIVFCLLLYSILLTFGRRQSRVVPYDLTG